MLSLTKGKKSSPEKLKISRKSGVFYADNVRYAALCGCNLGAVVRSDQ
jgi:hypothetical protein